MLNKHFVKKHIEPLNQPTCPSIPPTYLGAKFENLIIGSNYFFILIKVVRELNFLDT